MFVLEWLFCAPKAILEIQEKSHSLHQSNHFLVLQSRFKRYLDCLENCLQIHTKEPNDEKLLVSQCKGDLQFLNEQIDRLMQMLSPKINELRKIKAINKQQAKNYALYEAQIQKWAQLFYVKPLQAKLKAQQVDHSLLGNFKVSILKSPYFPIQFEKQISEVTSLTSLLNIGKDLLRELDRLIEIAQKITQANKTVLRRHAALVIKKQDLCRLMHWQQSAAQQLVSPYEAASASQPDDYCNMV